MPALSLLRVLTMLAMLLMPLAMAGQGHAAAAAAPHHQMAAPAAEEDCHKGKPGQQDRRQDAAAQCMMACAALPAAEAPRQDQAQVLRPSLYALTIVPIGGLAPEAETPPPRTA
jgi:hypothetical protein